MNTSEASRDKPLTPGEVPTRNGILRLPARLITGDDIETPVAWSAWQEPAWHASGTAGRIRLHAQLDTTDGTHLRLDILNDGPDPVELREAAWQLVIEQPDTLELVPECGIATSKPWDFNLTHETLTDQGRTQRCLRLTYGDTSWFLGSADPMLYADGHLCAEPHSPNDDLLRLSWHRVEPKWEYNGMVATRPLNGLWIHEGQTRMATIDIAETAQRLNPPQPSLPTNTEPLRLSLPGAERRYDRSPILEAIKRMAIARGEYAGLFAGGYDHRNQRIVEPHVCRAEYGEFLLHEFLRTGDATLWEWVTTFAERFERVCMNRSSHPERGGAVRGRYGDNNNAHPIRSMRGAAFFWDMADLTGIESYRRTAIGIADYLTRVFPWTNARQAAAVRDLAYMNIVTDDVRYLDTAREILALLEDIQQPEGAWFEYWNDKGEAYVYDNPTHHGGEWTHESPLKPEMQSYNINGLLDALKLNPDIRPGTSEMVHRATEWMLDAQHPEGAWPFPSKDSRCTFGYALMLDAAAMLKAGKFFDDERYTESGRRGIAFGLDQIEQVGFVPGLIGLPDVDQVEASLTCFYALEALAAAEQ